MWKLTPNGRRQQALYGVPWRDLSDEEFAAAEVIHPALRERGYFYEVPESVPGLPPTLSAPNEETAPWSAAKRRTRR